MWGIFLPWSGCRSLVLGPSIWSRPVRQTGLEFREGALVINEKNTRELKSGMVLNVALGLQNVPNPASTTDKDRVYGGRGGGSRPPVRLPHRAR